MTFILLCMWLLQRFSFILYKLYILYLPLLYYQSLLQLAVGIQPSGSSLFWRYITWRHLCFITGISFILILVKKVPTYEPKSAVQNLYIFVKLDIYCKDRYISHSAEQNLVPVKSNLSSL